MTHNASSVELHKEGTYVFTLTLAIFHPVFALLAKYFSIQMRTDPYELLMRSRKSIS